MTRKEKRKVAEAIGWLFAGLLFIGVFMFIDWFWDEYFFELLLLAAGIFPLLIFISAVGCVVSLVALIAGKE